MGESWQAAWTEDGIRKKKSGFKLRADAERFLLEKEGEIAQGLHRPAGEKMTIADACDKYLELMAQRVAQDTVVPEYFKQLKGHVKNYIARGTSWEPNQLGKTARDFDRGLGNIKLRKLRPAHVEQFRDDLLAAGLHFSTVRAVLTTLGAVLDMARRRDLVAVNAAEKIKVLVPRAARSQRRFPPSREAVHAALHLADPHLRFLILLVASTGLRTGELRALRHRNIDLDDLTLTVEESANTKNVIGPPKSTASIRDIPISDQLAQAYGEYRESLDFNGDDDLVMPNRDGEVAFSNFLLHKLYRCFNGAGWPKKGAGGAGTRRFNIHELRHFAISSWIAADLGLKAVQTYAGHSDVKMTWNRYGHLFPDDRRVEKINKAAEIIFA